MSGSRTANDHMGLSASFGKRNHRVSADGLAQSARAMDDGEGLRPSGAHAAPERRQIFVPVVDISGGRGFELLHRQIG
jgi:hypothetical protein